MKMFTKNRLFTVQPECPVPRSLGIWIHDQEKEAMRVRHVCVKMGSIELQGELTIPPTAGGLVIFAHGSGSSRLSTRNQFVARTLNQAGSATLLFDLLTHEEERQDMESRHLRFDIHFL